MSKSVQLRHKAVKLSSRHVLAGSIINTVQVGVDVAEESDEARCFGRQLTRIEVWPY